MTQVQSPYIRNSNRFQQLGYTSTLQGAWLSASPAPICMHNIPELGEGQQRPLDVT